MNRVVLGVLVLAAISVTSADAWASADSELFGENVQNLDASLSLRRTTTEQFNPIRGQSVLQRPRPDFDPVPIPIGSFQLFPSLNVGTYYDTNIFAQQTGGPDDEVWKINPTVSLLSNWGRHALGITALGDIDFFTYHDEQNYQGGAIQMEGRYDLGEQTWLSGTGGYQRVTEAKGSPATPGNSVGMSQYNLYTGTAEFYRGVGLLKVKGDYDFGYYEYSPIDIIGGPTNASQSGRDRTQNKISGEISYDVSENLRPFVRGGYNMRNYVTSGLRSSDGYQADAGARMDFGGIITTEAYLGWISQTYNNFGTGEVSGPDFGGDILWNVTELTSIEARVNRSIQETTNAGDASFLASEASVSISHELMRNIILQGSVTYDALDYQGARRHDDLYNIGAGGRYFFNRHLYGDLTYNMQRLTSDAPGSDYDAHTIFLRFGAQY